jgi:hypothetical protein
LRKLLVFVLVGYFTVNAHSQVKKVIKKGRRFKSESQFALKKNDFQAEWEIGKETIDSELATIVYPNFVLHYAISDRMEVNTEMTLITATDNSYSAKKNTTGIEPVLIGANYQILRDTHNSPSIIVSGQLSIPFLSTKQFTINYLAPAALIDIQEALHQKWIFGLSSGLQWDGYSTSPTFTYNASSSYSYKTRWIVTAEYFGFVNHDKPQNNLDASLAYVINDLVQFGITAGTGISSAAPKNYFAVTGSWGFNTSRKR